MCAIAASAILMVSGCSALASQAPQGTHTATASATPTPAHPAVTSVEPSSGSVSGGNTVTLRGTGLNTVTGVSVGGQPAAMLAGTTSTQVRFTLPASNEFVAGPVSISVSSASGVVATLANAYTYQVITPVDKQLNYAMRYWQTYNLAQYGNLNPVGGDCANFVSQTLVARGWPMNAQWYNHDAAAHWSPAWGYVPAMDDYLRAHAATLGLTEHPLSDRSDVHVGDLVMFDWNNNGSLDHVMVVSKVISTPAGVQVQMVGHNLDYDYRDLDQTITQQHPGATGHFWDFSS